MDETLYPFDFGVGGTSDPWNPTGYQIPGQGTYRDQRQPRRFVRAVSSFEDAASIRITHATPLNQQRLLAIG